MVLKMDFCTKRENLDIDIVNGSCEWSSPSNIALVKYWGKKEGIQIPANASVSFTLTECQTKTRVSWSKRTKEKDRFSFLFEGSEKKSFHGKIEKFLDNVEQYFPTINQLSLLIESSNSFPHSAGIASSASSMSALALCIVEIEKFLFKDLSQDTFLKRASFFARLGSGSACRSVLGPVVEWGVESDLFASSVESIHSDFDGFCDSILIVKDSEKSVSSRAGHGLMNDHPFSKARYKQAEANIGKMLDSLRNGDFRQFGETLEDEALSLHAMMMTSSPGYLLMAPNTIILIELVREFRKQSNIPIYFTLDAGPNLHLLYPKKFQLEVKNWIEDSCSNYLVGQKVIHDKLGLGSVGGLL